MRLALALALQVAAAQQAPSPAPGDETAWHVVAPGETLEQITRDYLGSAELWEDNWRLTPTSPTRTSARSVSGRGTS